MSMPSSRLLRLAAGATLALMARSGLADSGTLNTSTEPEAGAAERGEQVFLSHGCVYCHENGGRSAGKGPQLMGTSRDDSFIAFRIMNGKEGRMPAFGSALTGEQVLDVIAYIRSLKE
jgi:mono/diheme cytochrome c family protein